MILTSDINIMSVANCVYMFVTYEFVTYDIGLNACVNIRV